MQHLKIPRYNGVQLKSVEVDAMIAELKPTNTTSESLYMIIDCAHDPRIYPAILQTLNAKCCLFTEEKISESIKAVAPFLVKIKQMDEFMRWCVQEGVHRNWMIFFTSKIHHVSDLRLHLKRFSIAQGPEGKQYFFRFYDPRVLPVFLMSSETDRGEMLRHIVKISVPKSSAEGALGFIEFTMGKPATQERDSAWPGFS